jgi:hypothetical protein
MVHLLELWKGPEMDKVNYLLVKLLVPMLMEKDLETVKEFGMGPKWMETE